MAKVSIDAVMSTFPRCPLCHLPTPLEKLPALSRELGINLFVKRDDQTGLAFGGNKSRKLEFVIGDALSKGAVSIITWAGVQSNWCRQLAAASRKVGIKPILVLFRRPGLPADVDGNLLLDYLLDAEIHVKDLGTRDMMSFSGVLDFIQPIVEQERASGRITYVAPIGAALAEGSMTRPLGAIAYVDATAELLTQAQTLGIHVDHVVTATSSGSMQAGLIAGAKFLNAGFRTTGIAVSDDTATLTALVSEIVDQVTRNEFRETVKLTADDVIVNDEYIGEGYGITNAETISAITTTAVADGLLLDPVYTGKAMRGLFDLAKRGYFQSVENVVFLHTGGLPALFPYRTELTDYLSARAKVGGEETAALKYSR
jgi:D-cysteine desulfhydrase/L-cysteate sulfo-lyase